MKRLIAKLSARLFFEVSCACWLAGLCCTAQDARTTLTLIRSQHLRVAIPVDIQRLAVGDPEMLSAEPLNSREILLLGKNSGTTSLLVWLRDGSIREYVCKVHRDFTLLESALKRIHPAIEVEVAPDRDAVVLTGTVPDVTYLRAAEEAAQSYLDSSSNKVLVRDNKAETKAEEGVDSVRVPTQIATGGRNVINLIRLEQLPLLSEEKILESIREIGGGRVTVRRIVRGQTRDDKADVFVLEGRVPNQVALTRVLTLASKIVTGQATNTQDMQVITDEAGALAFANQGGGAAGGAGGGGAGGGGAAGGGGGGMGGGAGRANLTNQIRRNLGRAKAIQAGGGRILSFIAVTDIPQVRVDIRLFEVNRSKLKSFNPSLTTILGSKKLGALSPSPLARGVQNQPSVVGPGNAVQNVLGFLSGALVNQTQFTAGHFAMDAVLSYLEQQGIARSLSSPSMTVLSGEQAQFQVGGSIPVNELFSPAFGGTGNAAGTGLGVFLSVSQINFGVELSVRPLVGDDDTLTLDVLPSITTPDTSLTATIRQATGTNPATTAFQTRSLRTSARLQDGQALVIGGLVSRNTNDKQDSTPGLRDAPGFGWLFKNLNRNDDSQELIIVVNPTIVRDPIPDAALWEFPGTSELMKQFWQERP